LPSNPILPDESTINPNSGDHFETPLKLDTNGNHFFFSFYR
jgi:hypothetical protein